MPTKIFLEGFLNTNRTSVYPRIFHKFFFDILKKDFREYLHSFEKKPFSLYFYIKNNKFFLEINILRDDLINPILSDIFNFAILEKEFFYMQEEEKVSFKILPQKIKVKTFLKFEEILSMEKLSNDFLIDIKSPFSFKRYDYDYFLPENLLVIEDLLEKFNLFSSIKITISKEEKKYILKNFILSGLWGNSKKVILDKKAKFLGFKGRLYFFYKGDNINLKNKLHHLFIFSNFCGIGRKNTMGMGKVVYSYD